MTMALLAYRNTPDRDTKRSPAQVLYARQLREAVPCEPSRLRVRKEWLLTREAREKALAKRHEVRGEQWAEHTRGLAPLVVGTTVQVQNQTGPHKNKWDLSGTVVEVLEFEAYTVKMDGSGRLTKRNRKFLRLIVPYKTVLDRSSDGSGSGLGRTGQSGSQGANIKLHCSGDPAAVTGGPSYTGGDSGAATESAIAPTAVSTGTNGRGPQLPPPANRVVPPKVTCERPPNGEPPCVQSIVRAGPAGQWPLLSEKPVSRFSRGSTGVLRPVR